MESHEILWKLMKSMKIGECHVQVDVEISSIGADFVSDFAHQCRIKEVDPKKELTFGTGVQIACKSKSKPRVSNLVVSLVVLATPPGKRPR